MTLLSICMTILMAVAQVQQPSVIDFFRQNVSENCLSMDYEYAVHVTDDMTVRGEGSIIMQGNSYHLNANDMEVYCDGETIWWIDEAAQEVIIEAVGSDSEVGGFDTSYLTNPVMILKNLEDSGVSYDVEGNKISLNMPDEQKLDIMIKSLEIVTTKKPEALQPPIKFPKGWIVTDLR